MLISEMNYEYRNTVGCIEKQTFNKVAFSDNRKESIQLPNNRLLHFSHTNRCADFCIKNDVKMNLPEKT